jgi:hypothetical protein
MRERIIIILDSNEIERILSLYDGQMIKRAIKTSDGRKAFRNERCIFYTDVKYQVEYQAMKGVRLVLQFDVYKKRWFQ